MARVRRVPTGAPYFSQSTTHSHPSPNDYPVPGTLVNTKPTMQQSTSIRAFLTGVAPTLGQRQAAVLRCFGPGEALSNRDIKERLRWEINCVTGRVKELRETGYLEEAGRRPCGFTGHLVLTWRVVESRPEPSQRKLF